MAGKNVFKYMQTVFWQNETGK